MSWNKYYIFVNQQPNPDLDKLLPKLGLDHYSPKGEVNLYETNKPQTLFIGHHKDCLIFCDFYLPFTFFGAGQTIEEKRFIACFPNSEILVMIEDGTVDSFGFCVIKNGKKIRMKDGCDGEIYNDFGTPFPEEAENYEDIKATIGEFEKAEIIENEDKEGFENYLVFQAAWGIPDILSERFLGESISYINGEEIKFMWYQKNSSKK